MDSGKRNANPRCGTQERFLRTVLQKVASKTFSKGIRSRKLSGEPSGPSFKTSVGSRSSQSQKAGSRPNLAAQPRGAKEAPWSSYYEQETRERNDRVHRKELPKSNHAVVNT